LLQALLQHNHVIKQAADDNIGYVLEQEGHSFALAFHDAHDAAAFALQVIERSTLSVILQHVCICECTLLADLLRPQRNCSAAATATEHACCWCSRSSRSGFWRDRAADPV
jgi:hypothetical protein